jgi:hypothetical protein
MRVHLRRRVAKLAGQILAALRVAAAPGARNAAHGNSTTGCQGYRSAEPRPADRHQPRINARDSIGSFLPIWASLRPINDHGSANFTHASSLDRSSASAGPAKYPVRIIRKHGQHACESSSAGGGEIERFA